MEAQDAKEINGFEIRVLKRFVCKALLSRDFQVFLSTRNIDCNQRIFLTLKEKKYPDKVISSMIQTNINIYIYSELTF